MSNCSDFLDAVQRNRKLDMKPVKSFKNAHDFIRHNICMGYHLGKETRILDIGCNDGSFLLPLKDYYITEGWDICQEAVNACSKKGIDAIVKDANEGMDNIASKSYDVITMFSTLEHVKAPQYFLADINRILKKGGYLILEIPNASYFMNWIAVCLLPKYIGLASSFATWDHCNHFNAYDIKYLMKKLGFEIIKIERFPFLHPSLHAYARKINNCKNGEWLASHPTETLKWRI